MLQSPCKMIRYGTNNNKEYNAEKIPIVSGLNLEGDYISIMTIEGTHYSAEELNCPL